MRFITILVVLLVIVAGGCERKSNQALYDEVMSVHDEVMPKMNDIYKAKTALRTELATPGLSEARIKQINDKISQLDSADESMMVWMRKFNPIPDSLGEEKAREYLEKELMKIKQVRENIQRALQNSQGAD